MLQRWAARHSNLLLLPFCLLGGAIMSARDGTDANWDLQNYHIYGPGALLAGRIGRDYLAAGIQGYLNPLADIPYFVTKFVLFPHHAYVVALLAGLPFGLLGFVVISIARLLAPAGALEPFAAAFLGLTGATTLSEVGTTQDDILAAFVVLLGMFVLLRPGGAIRLQHAGCAGFIFGFAVGIKLTALIFLPGFAVMAMIQTNGPRRRFFICSAVMIASFTGFLAAYGWWGCILWRHYGSPFYPYFGNFFSTPWGIDMEPQSRIFFQKISCNGYSTRFSGCNAVPGSCWNSGWATPASQWPLLH